MATSMHGEEVSGIQSLRPNQGCYTFFSYIASRRLAPKRTPQDIKRKLKNTKMLLVGIKLKDTISTLKDVVLTPKDTILALKDTKRR